MALQPLNFSVQCFLASGERPQHRPANYIGGPLYLPVYIRGFHVRSTTDSSFSERQEWLHLIIIDEVDAATIDDDLAFLQLMTLRLRIPG